MDDLHPSCYDAVERLKVMDEVGVYAAALYPNINVIHKEVHSGIDDPEFKYETIAAYNDWLVEWASVAPERLLAIAIVPHFDPVVGAKEVYRAKELGHRGVVMSGLPQLHGEPYLADRYWDPVWAAAEETGLPVSFHLGVGPNPAPDMPARVAVEGVAGFSNHAVVDMLLGNATSCADLLMSGILPRFPGIRFVSAEGGIGWVNFMLETLDYHFDRLETRQERPEFEERPSFYFRRQVWVTYWFEKMYQHHVDLIGADRILVETDYPHVTALEPGDIDWVRNHGLADVSDDVKEHILWRNAAELYGVNVPA
jgi:predicted TIM-barrel fold metal-dependent hydrolase